MTVDRKLMRNGNGWALTINSTILGFLDVNPEVDMVRYTMENDKLIIMAVRESHRHSIYLFNYFFYFRTFVNVICQLF